MRIVPFFLGLGLTASALAQSVPDVPNRHDLRPNAPFSTLELQREIESLLGDSEMTLMQGLVDPGVDWGRLATEKLLDETIKAVASSAVLAPAAEKIMSLYYKKKQQRLADELGKLRQVMKDGQARLNKIRYQAFKVKAEHRKAFTKAGPALKSSPHGVEAEAALKALYGNGSDVMAQFDGAETARILREDFDAFRGGKSTLGYDAFLTAYAALGNGDAERAKLVVARTESKLAYASPYQRLVLLRSARRDARLKNNALLAMKGRSYQALAYQKRRRLENRAVETYRVKTYTKYR
jgi:hypothetical protein